MSDKTDKEYLLDLLSRVSEFLKDSLEPIAFEVRSATKIYQEGSNEEV